MLRELLIREAVLYTAGRKILREDWTIERAREVGGVLRGWKEELPAYNDPEYIDKAVALYEMRSNQIAS
jgi:hypothetical protein